MTEVEKMRNGLLADMSSPELQVRFEHAKKLLARMRGMSTYDEGYRKLLEELVPGMPETSVICPFSGRGASSISLTRAAHAEERVNTENTFPILTITKNACCR